MGVGGFTHKRALPKTEKGVVLVDEITDGALFNFRDRHGNLLMGSGRD